MKHNNRGVSLIEVVVVMTIMVVLISSSFVILSYVLKGDIKKASKTLYSEIASCRTYSMAKTGDWQFVVTHDGTKYVLSTSWDDEGTLRNFSEEELSERVDNIQVTCDGTTAELGTIEFQKNTGAVIKIVSLDGTTVLYNRNAAGFPLAGYADIDIMISGNKRTLRLYYLTGEIESL